MESLCARAFVIDAHKMWRHEPRYKKSCMFKLVTFFLLQAYSALQRAHCSQMEKMAMHHEKEKRVLEKQLEKSSKKVR